MANLLVILFFSLPVREVSSGGASGEWESACARLCCSKLYSLSSASNVPERQKEKVFKDNYICLNDSIRFSIVVD